MRSIWLCVVLVASCGKKTETSAPAADQPAPAPAAIPAAPPAVAPTGGPLTVQKIMAAKTWFKAFEPWDASLAKAQAELGPPTRIKHSNVDNTDAYEWAAMDGDDCALLSFGKMDGKLLKKDGDVVGNAYPMLFKNDGKLEAQRNECLDAAKAAKK